MKLLLDENLPIKLKRYFTDQHVVHTVRELGWSGKKNGDLLTLIERNGFDGLVTIDKNLRHQQNLSRFDVKILILNASDNKLLTLKPFVKKLEVEIALLPEEKIIEITA